MMMTVVAVVTAVVVVPPVLGIRRVLPGPVLAVLAVLRSPIAGVMGAAWQRAGQQNRQAGGERQTEFAHDFPPYGFRPYATLTGGFGTLAERHVQQSFNDRPTFG